MSTMNRRGCIAMAMKKSWVLGIIALLVLSSIGTACGIKKDESSMTTTTASGTKNDGQSAGAVPLDGKPSLDAKIVLEGTSATITYKVSNLKLSPDHMGGQNVPGEGHLHLVVDGQQKAMLKTDAPVTLENLSAGKHTVKLNLQQNDHTDLNVEKVFPIVVK
jgi:hypothetical protein